MRWENKNVEAGVLLAPPRHRKTFPQKDKSPPSPGAKAVEAMAEQKVKEFPELAEKLSAPTKKSLFERQKAEAEAKRLREEAETAAVYEDFVKSFEDEPNVKPTPGPGGGPSRGGIPFGPTAGAGFGCAPPKRHFAPSARGNSGPGSLGPAPGLRSLKRAHDGSFANNSGKSQRGLLAFEDLKDEREPLDPATVFRTSDDEAEADADTNRRLSSQDRPAALR